MSGRLERQASQPESGRLVNNYLIIILKAGVDPFKIFTISIFVADINNDATLCRTRFYQVLTVIKATLPVLR